MDNSPLRKRRTANRKITGAQEDVIRGPKDAARPGPKPLLSLPQIAQAAIHLADAEGLGAVSMERVARKLNVTTMALYRYLSGKQALFELMIENAAVRSPNFLKSGKGWRPKLAAWMQACLSIYRTHPWLLRAALGPRTMGPNELRWLDSALAILGEAGIAPPEQHEIFLLLIGYVRSTVEFENANRHGWRIRVEPKTVLPPDQPREEPPALTLALESESFRKNANRAFDIGAECILGGIESVVRSRRRGDRAGDSRTS